MPKSNKKKKKNRLNKTKSSKRILDGSFAKSAEEKKETKALENKKQNVATKNKTQQKNSKKTVSNPKKNVVKKKESFWAGLFNFKSTAKPKIAEKNSNQKNKVVQPKQEEQKNDIFKPKKEEQKKPETTKPLQQKTSFGSFFNLTSKDTKEVKKTEIPKKGEIASTEINTKKEDIKTNEPKKEVEQKKESSNLVENAKHLKVPLIRGKQGVDFSALDEKNPSTPHSTPLMGHFSREEKTLKLQDSKQKIPKAKKPKEKQDSAQKSFWAGLFNFKSTAKPKIAEKNSNQKNKVVQPKQEEQKNDIFKPKKEEQKKPETTKPLQQKTSFGSFFNLTSKDTKEVKKTEIPKKEEIASTEINTKKEDIKTNEAKKENEKRKMPKIKSPTGILSRFFSKEEQNQVSPKKSTTEDSGKKNLFVDLFPQEVEKDEDDSLIETIVEQSNHQTSILGQKLQDKRTFFEETQNVEKNQEEPSGKLIFWSRITLLICFFIPIFVYLYFYYQVTPQSKILDLFAIQNLGMRYAETSKELEDLNTEIQKINTEIKKLEENSPQKLQEETIATIKANSIQWLVVLEQINEVTNQGVKYNDLLHRVTYTSYSFDGENNKISLSTEIFDPNKQAFNVATSLIDAVNDSEYFEGLENRSFSKSLEEEGAKMSLSLNFSYIPESKRENLSTVLENAEQNNASAETVQEEEQNAENPEEKNT